MDLFLSDNFTILVVMLTATVKVVICHISVTATRVLLMPQAKTRDELLAKSPMVAELCKQTGFTFCNRLQILLYNGQRGK
jgi:hypothetical protein